MFGHITQKQWDAHPSFRKELKEILEHPAFKAAFGIVMDKGMKVSIISPVEPTAFAALMGSRKDGYFEALDNLVALTEPAAARAPEVKPWYNKDRDGKTQPPANAPL